MLLLGHLYFAKKVEIELSIKKIEDYFLGAILLDFRYYLGHTRTSIHMSLETLPQKFPEGDLRKQRNPCG